MRSNQQMMFTHEEMLKMYQQTYILMGEKTRDYVGGVILSTKAIVVIEHIGVVDLTKRFLDINNPTPEEITLLELELGVDYECIVSARG